MSYEEQLEARKRAIREGVVDRWVAEGAPAELIVKRFNPDEPRGPGGKWTSGAAKRFFRTARSKQTPADKKYYDDQLAQHDGDHLALVRAWHANSSPGDKRDIEAGMDAARTTGKRNMTTHARREQAKVRQQAKVTTTQHDGDTFVHHQVPGGLMHRLAEGARALSDVTTGGGRDDWTPIL